MKIRAQHISIQLLRFIDLRILRTNTHGCVHMLLDQFYCYKRPTLYEVFISKGVTIPVSLYTQSTWTNWREFVCIVVFRLEIRFIGVPDPWHQRAQLNKLYIIRDPQSSGAWSRGQLDFGRWCPTFSAELPHFFPYAQKSVSVPIYGVRSGT
jgi:hypothetical protein